MDKLQTISQPMAYAIFAFIVFLAILPVIIASSRTGKVLELATAALCVTSLIGTGGAFGLGMMGVFVVIPFLSAMWMASLLCGLACCMNKAADRRANDMAFRLLYNEPENLIRPRDVSAARRVQ